METLLGYLQLLLLSPSNDESFFQVRLLFPLQVQIDNDKIRRDRESRGSRIDLSGLCVSSNTTTQSIATMRQHPEQQRTQSSRVRNSNGLIIDSQGNSIPLSPVSSNTSSGSDTMEQPHKPVPMTPSGEFADFFPTPNEGKLSESFRFSPFGN
jgi:hypothetical protein